MDMIPAIPNTAPVCIMNSLRLVCSGALISATADFSVPTISALDFSISRSPLRYAYRSCKTKKAPDRALAQWDAFVLYCLYFSFSEPPLVR
jgi:hypothetical protein